MPVYNGENFLREAMTSVLDQLGPHGELLIVDDHSTDRTRAAANLPDHRISLLTNSGRGVSAARNTGILAARGEFIGFLDHDDLWPSGRQRVLVSELRSRRTASAAAGSVRVIAESGIDAGQHRLMDGRYAPSMLSSCLYRKELIDRIGGFAEDLRFGEDLDFHFRLIEAGMKITRCACDTLIYRRHSGNVSSMAPPSADVLKSILRRKIQRMHINTSIDPSLVVDIGSE